MIDRRRTGWERNKHQEHTINKVLDVGIAFTVNLNDVNLKWYDIYIKFPLYAKLKRCKFSQIKNSSKYCIFTKVKGLVKCIYATDTLSGNKDTCHSLLRLLWLLW